MISYTKTINWLPVFTGITLGLALLIGATIKQTTSRACFFIGNGAYYALSAQDSYDNPPAYDSFKTSKEFVENFSPDSVFSDFTRALHEKEQNIFVTYKTWNSFVHLNKRIKEVFADFGITKPLEQIFIDDTAQLPQTIQKKLQKNLIVPGCTPQNCYNQDIIPLYHPLLFYGPTADKLVDISVADRLETFKNQSGLLHPFFSKLFHFLIIFNPSEWRMYNTNTGFYYLTPRESGSTAVSITSFTQLDTATAYDQEPEITCTIHEDDWAFHLDKLFDHNTQKWQIYLTGHGSDPIYSGKEILEELLQKDGQVRMRAWIGGVPSLKFKPFLEFLDKKLNTEKLFISSCHVPAKRLLNLADTTLSYKVISPIASYDTVTCYVPFGYITSYIPAHLNPDQKPKISYTLKPSESDACTPLNIPKYSSLLSTDDEPEILRQHIDTFVYRKAFESPSVIEAHSTKVERITA